MAVVRQMWYIAAWAERRALLGLGPLGPLGPFYRFRVFFGRGGGGGGLNVRVWSWEF